MPSQIFSKTSFRVNPTQTQPNPSPGLEVMNRINQTQSDGLNRINVLFTRCRQWSKYAALGLALLAGIQLPAQTVTFVGPRLRATIPVGVSSSLILSNSMACTTNGSTAVDETGTNLIIAPVTLDVTGLPAGMSYSITNFGITNLYVSAYRTNNATYRLWLTLVSDGTVAEGTYTFSLNANGGATNNLLYTLDVAHVWNGTTNAAAAGSVFEWSVTTNWLGDGFAGTNANSIVVFTDWGGQTNSLTGYGSASTNYLTSSIKQTVRLSGIIRLRSPMAKN
jgi:hypothetical protein